MHRTIIRNFVAVFRRFYNEIVIHRTIILYETKIFLFLIIV